MMNSNSLSVRALVATTAVALMSACAKDATRPAESAVARIDVASSAVVPLTSLGDTARVTSQALDRRGAIVGDAALSWSVTPAGILHEDAPGVFRAIGNGRATVVASLAVGSTGVKPAGYWASPVADSVVVEVHQRAARIALASVDTAFTSLGGRRQLRAIVADARGNALLEGTPTLTWWSTDTRVATVDSTGLVRSAQEGNARIVVQVGSLGTAASFTVRPRVPHTSCMVYAQRKQTRQSCVTLDFVMREREDAR